MTRLSREKISLALLIRSRRRERGPFKMLQLGAILIQPRLQACLLLLLHLLDVSLIFNRVATEKDRKAKRREAKEKSANADDPKAGADVGKIVNLMAGDANKVSPRFCSDLLP
jgi:hypothetical protein